MTNNVYANKNAVAAKAGLGKVIAAFPDVCMSPPAPPAGPVPIPYPNTSFARDLKAGSKTVMVGGKPLALQDQSYYKSSPLGNEAATRSFGASVVTHQITGETYFAAWSMDVKVQGKNVCRHLDLTTSNHASQPGATPPNPNAEAMDMGQLEDEENTCGCCGGQKHSQGSPMTFDDFYGLNETRPNGQLTQKATERRAFVEMVKAKKAHGCSCNGKLLPEAPCNVFRKPVTATEKGDIESLHYANRKKYRQRMGVPKSTSAAELLFPGQNQKFYQDVVQINHLTPKVGGGCPTGDSNLQAHFNLCKKCQEMDGEFTKWQSEHQAI